MDIIRRFKWRELNAARVRKKVKKLVEPFINNIEKGKVILSIEPHPRDRAHQFSESKPTLVEVNNRTNFILKTIDSDVPKGDEACKMVEKSIGLSYSRNFETGCIRHQIIKHLYVKYPVDFQCGVGKIEDNHTTGGVLMKEVGALSFLRAEGKKRRGC
jgi:hypothetical protein